MTRTVLAAVLGLVIATATARADMAGADLIARAQDAADKVDFEGARTLIVRAIAEGGLSTGELARAQRFAGEVAASLGDDTGARRHFLEWLLLDPNAALAPGVSPKIARAFDGARDELDRVGTLELTVRAERSPGSVRIVVEGRDPLQMVARLRVTRVGQADRTVAGRSADLAIDDTAEITATVTALDRHGNALWVGDARSEPRAALVRRGFPGWARWPTWTAVAVVSGAAGGYFAWQTGRDRSQLDALHTDSSQHDYDEARALEQRGRRDALLTNVAFGLAGASAIAAALTYALEPGGVELRPVVTPGGAGVSASIHF